MLGKQECSSVIEIKTACNRFDLMLNSVEFLFVRNEL